LTQFIRKDFDRTLFRSKYDQEIVDWIQIAKLLIYCERHHIISILDEMRNSKSIVENSLEHLIDYFERTYLDQFEITNWNRLLSETDHFLDCTTNIR
jgi:hypothetical protein